jgi:hypothetical protein
VADLAAEPQHERGIQADEKPNPAKRAYMKPASIIATGLVLGFVGIIGVFFLQSSSTTPPRSSAAMEDVLALMHRGDYTTALPLMRSLADHGDVLAQRGLGILYESADGRGASSRTTPSR